VAAASTWPVKQPPLWRARVCRAWQVPHSSDYAAHAATTTKPKFGPVVQPGPKPVVADAGLQATVRADLERSPWTGEGHWKVWARLHAQDVLRVARKRVLRKPPCWTDPIR